MIGRAVANSAAHLRHATWRIDRPVVATALGAPVTVMLLVGRNDDVQIIRAMSLLALCVGAVAAVSFDDEASALTASLPTPHWRRQGAVGVVVGAACSLWWTAGTGIAVLLGEAVPAAALAITGLVLFLSGGVIGLIVARRGGPSGSPWAALSTLLVVVATALIAWRPLAVLDPDDPAWDEAHRALLMATLPLAALAFGALTAPDLRAAVKRVRPTARGHP